MEKKMSYDRNDMYYQDYHWTSKGNELQVKQATAFKADDGNIILYMINSLTQNLLDSKILEIIIHEFVPQTVNTVKQAYEWVKKQGDRYYKLVLRSIVKSD